MSDADMQEEEMRTNLRDADCSCEKIEQIINCHKSGDTSKELKLLLKQRCDLVDEIHVRQKKLDCLDYLIYKLKKSKGLGCCCKRRKDK